MGNIRIENILLKFGNRLLETASGKGNPTLGELIDEPTADIVKYVTNTTVKCFVYTHEEKYSDFLLGLSAGYIDEEGRICNQQKGAEDTLAIGMPIYTEQYELIGNLSIGLWEHLDYAERTSDGQEIPVYHWKVDGYKGKRQNVKTYYQKLATTPTPQERIVNE
jgi:hypothetical protein